MGEFRSAAPERLLGIAMLPMHHTTGEDNVIWAWDYPHFDAIWPNSRKYIDEHMGFLSPAARRKVTCDNAVTLYNLA